MSESVAVDIFRSFLSDWGTVRMQQDNVLENEQWAGGRVDDVSNTRLMQNFKNQNNYLRIKTLLKMSTSKDNAIPELLVTRPDAGVDVL